jgi:hypothetical protein
MEDKYAFPFVRKVMVVAVGVWTAACAYMYWTMPNTSRGLFAFFVFVYGFPVTIMLGLLAISWWFARNEPIEPVHRGVRKAPSKGKKVKPKPH